MHAIPTTPTPNPAASFGVILRHLAALIAHRFLRDPFHAALIVPLWQYLTRAAFRLDRLLVRLAAGPLPPPRPRTGNQGNRSSAPRRPSVFPKGHAWLIRALGAEAAAYASQLENLLADPAAADLLACAAARRTLAPIRRMLGLPPAAKPSAAKPPAAPPSPAPQRPTQSRRAPPRPEPVPHHPTIDPVPSGNRRPWWLPPPPLRSG